MNTNKKKLSLSAVIISFNSERFLEKNLHSLLEQSYPFTSILVVDNASSDRSTEIINSFPSPVRCIALPSNTGYAAAANHGIHLLLSEGTDLILIGNSDIILDIEFNRETVALFNEKKDIGMLSPLILRFDKQTVDSAGQECSRSLYPSERGYNRPKETVDLHPEEVFSVCGAATVFSREALEQLKLCNQFYDEDFFMFWEDFDIGWRAQLLGIPVHFTPLPVVYHYRSGTLEKSFLSRFSLALARPPLIKYHLVKNRFLTLIKNFRFSRNILSIPFIIFKDIIWVSLLTFSSPKIIIPLMKSGGYIKRALEKRKLIRERQLRK